MTRHKLWPTYFLEDINPSHKEIDRQLRQYIYLFDRKTKQSKMGRALKRNISEPPFDFLELAHKECEEFETLISWIDSRMRSFLNPLIRPSIERNLRWAIHHCESWYHITREGGFHSPHMHSNTSWGWIYYFDNIDVRKYGGSNKFYNPLSQHVTYVDVGLRYMETLDWSFFEVNPKAGKLVVYPGWLLHDAQPYRGKKDRLILSGNTRVLATNA
jgi:uncharacterized protein (TIGR02466 family)